MSDHINGYALALFSIAKENNNIDEYKIESNNLIKVFSENIEYLKIMDSKDIDVNKKKEMINKAFDKALITELKNFLFILIERCKFRLLIKILKKLIKIINEFKDISEGIVFSPLKLTSNEMEKIEIETNEILGKKVFLINKIDKEIISGFRILVGDEIIEDTISSRFKKLKKELLERDK